LHSFLVVFLISMLPSTSVMQFSRSLQSLQGPVRLWIYIVLHFGLFSGLNVTFVFINTFMTWTEAQSYCRAHHTDLASVRNMSENQRVTEVLPAGQAAWIGLFRDSWKWTDGSNSTFRYWNTNQPDLSTGSKLCVSGLFVSLSGVWEDWNCDRKTAFICYSGKLHFVTFQQ
uniref:C-type lectin domain-containing protein n=1 Tax=Neolamprologus brichardi TaxID=32507 RepID=A0A3Q4H2U6_NEOBR